VTHWLGSKFPTLACHRTRSRTRMSSAAYAVAGSRDHPFKAKWAVGTLNTSTEAAACSTRYAPAPAFTALSNVSFAALDSITHP
jgi:hypothetical protein